MYTQMKDDDFQETLGDGEAGLAEGLAEERKQISIAEFFEKNKQMLGFDSDARALVTAIKEAVDNALDATEEIGVLPEISVDVEKSGKYYQVTVEDNGPGITKDQIPKVFGKLLYGSRFHARVQSRGQQGIGISAAVLYSQLTSGKSARITSKTQSHSGQYFELLIDTDENEAEIKKEETVEWAEKDHGTKIKLEMEANMRSRQQLHDYIKYTALVNPHATIKYSEPDFEMEYERVTDELPEETEEIKPHPHGVELGAVQDMLAKTDSYSLSGFFQEDFTRVGPTTAENILDTYRDYQYGREMAWTIVDKEALIGTIEDAIHGKGADATKEFATKLCSRIEESQPVSYTDINKFVNELAESVETSFGKTFGSTVREKATSAAWEHIRQDVYQEVYELVKETTSSKKDDETVSVLAEVIAEHFEKTGGKHRITKTELEDLVSEASSTATGQTGTSVGDKAQGQLVSAFWDRMTTVSEEVPSVKEIRGNRDKVANLMRAMHSTKVIAPPTKCLSPIYPDNIEKGMKKVFDAEFYSASTRDASVHSGDPFVVEAGIAYGGSLEAEGSIELTRFANRVPLVYQRGACSITDVVKGIGWRNYKLSQSGGYGLPDGPVVLLVHIASTNVPFTSEAKDAVANVPEIEDEIERAVREAARKLKSYLKEQQSLKKRREKEDVLARILPVMAEKAASIVGEEPADITQSQAKIMNSVLINQSRDEITLTNHSNSSESFSFTLDFASKPKYVSDVLERQQTDDGRWELVWNGTLQSGESVEASWNLDKGVHGPEFDVGLPMEKYSMIEQ
jgi:DNA topoisomerase-6 subunit B